MDNDKENHKSTHKVSFYFFHKTRFRLNFKIKDKKMAKAVKKKAVKKKAAKEKGPKKKVAKKKVAKKPAKLQQPVLVKGEFGEVIKVELNSPRSPKPKPVKSTKKSK